MGRTMQQNSITSPELLEAVNPENKRLKNDFLEYMRSTQKSEGTIEGYSNDIDIFFCWNLQFNRNKFFVDVKKRDLIAYQNWTLNVNKNSPARVRRLKACLSSMANYIENILDDEYPDFRNIVRKIESPVNQPVRDKTILSTEQVQSLLDHLVEEEKYMQAALVALAAASGARKSELTRFKTNYFTDDCLICGGSLWKTPEKIKTKGRGRGKYIYKYVIVSQFKPYLDLWMQEREKQGITDEWLFPSASDRERAVTTRTMDSWTYAYSRFLQVPFYWHSLRHYFTTNLARQGIPDSVIVSIVGWDSADMCAVYKDIDADEELESWFDADGVKKREKTSLADL